MSRTLSTGDKPPAGTSRHARAVSRPASSQAWVTGRRGLVCAALLGAAWAPALMLQPAAAATGAAPPAAQPAGKGRASPAAASTPRGGATGQRIATQGLPGTAASACIGCHGAQGEGNAAAGFPRLNGQAASYLQRQLAAYADGSRVNAVMQPIAKALQPAQQAAVASYFAALPLAAAPAASASGASGASAASAAPAASGQATAAGSPRGRVLAEVGDERLGVQACANCHGPGGNGRGDLAPALAGQHAGYLQAALKEWADGTRRTDASGQMPQIAARLGAADQQAVAAYFASQPLVSEAVPAPARPHHAAAVPSGPRPTAGGPAAPTGQGAAQPGTLTGGSQGPGGGGGGTGSGSSGGSGGTPTGR